VVNACGESVAGRAALADAHRIIARLGRPAINDPDRLRGLGRDTLAETLAGVAGVHVPAARRLQRGEAGSAFPLIVRPVDAHGGRGLERCDDPAALADYFARVAAATYDATPFVDYRSADGWYRKYRIMFVDGVPYPYHLAIDEHWMIHYYRTGTADTPWMREEETAFLAVPERALAGWRDALPALGAALGLDYVGIDCAQLADGTLLVFEADSAMLVHALDASESGRFKRAAVDRIRAALGALFERRAAGA
jgi:glutathione synthase/RimK-type ligase-like ATP-grasp enzyme